MLARVLPGTYWAILLVYLASIASIVKSTHGLDISYCSPENNAGSYPSYYSLYMSNGLCQDHCQGSYAFAVIEGYYCWCSNYIPADQESTYNCDQQCPGYGSEWCGNTDAGLYAYFLLSAGTPLGTSGTAASTAAAATTTSSSVSTSRAVPGSSYSQTTSNVPTTFSSSSLSSVATVGSSGSSQSSYEASSVTPGSSSAVLTTSPSSTSFITPSTTSTSTTSPTSTYIAPMTSSDPTTSAAPTTSVTPSPTTTATPTEVYTSVMTVTGEIRTVVVTPTASSDATLGQSATGGGGVSTGKVVGIVLGSALGVGALIGVGVWMWFRRRHRKIAEQTGPETSFVPRTGDASPSNNIPSRQVSQLSSSGLLGSKIPRINTAGMPPGNDPRSADTTSSGFDRRSLATDQRLNPYALYIHDESRLSNVSLQDNTDYSRQLRVANPD
ncbi:cell wall integrity and stress response component [Exophiala viscosa]|uniref:Cell wall integrity and stress response component n=1 Tax=Exophiala viscosa TaxID=2486360 RepID=A0AAN6E4B7_9EURO|nr:cell wall integrity and stress response component [Exophiala viscosa]